MINLLVLMKLIILTRNLIFFFIFELIQTLINKITYLKSNLLN